MRYLTFPDAISSKYRVVKERLGMGEYDVTIPLRRGRGFAYVYAEGWAGVWLTTSRPNPAIKDLRAEFPRMVLQQLGDGEFTFRIPMDDLDAVLTRRGGRIRRKVVISEERRQELRERMRAINEKSKNHGYRTPKSTQNQRSPLDRCDCTSGLRSSLRAAETAF